MALTTQTMTDEQRKSVALEYLKGFIYLDPDYAGRDTARYPWLAQRTEAGDAATPVEA